MKTTKHNKATKTKHSIVAQQNKQQQNKEQDNKKLRIPQIV